MISLCMRVINTVPSYWNLFNLNNSAYRFMSFAVIKGEKRKDMVKLWKE